MELSSIGGGTVCSVSSVSVPGLPLIGASLEWPPKTIYIQASRLFRIFAISIRSRKQQKKLSHTDLHSWNNEFLQGFTKTILNLIIYILKLVYKHDIILSLLKLISWHFEKITQNVNLATTIRKLCDATSFLCCPEVKGGRPQLPMIQLSVNYNRCELQGIFSRIAICSCLLSISSALMLLSDFQCACVCTICFQITRKWRHSSSFLIGRANSKFQLVNFKLWMAFFFSGGNKLPQFTA